jgi:hypothetical protein
MSGFRNKAAHGGYIDLEKHPLPDVFRCRVHLWDILLRAMLKAFGYEGTYNSPIIPAQTALRLDWVSHLTPPDSLGYSKAMDEWRFGRRPDATQPTEQSA